MATVGALGLPQVVSVGALDMVNFGPADSVPQKFAARSFVKHNPTDPFRLMPVFLRELARIGFTGVQNFPTVGLIDGTFRANLNVGHRVLDHRFFRPRAMAQGLWLLGDRGERPS